MRQFIKIFAIWFIAFAIPVQGVASVAMMNCEQTVDHHSHRSASNHHNNQYNEHNMAKEHAHEAVNPSANSSHATDNKHACAHCAKCATCCSGFTLVANVTNLFQQLNADEARFSYSAQSFTSFIPSGLERPPRFTLI